MIEPQPFRKLFFVFSLLIALVIVGLWFLFTRMFPGFENDVTITFVELGIIAFVFTYSQVSKYQLLLIFLGAFLLLNLIVFPYLYLITIKNDNESFVLEGSLKTYIKIQELKNIENSANFKEEAMALKIIQRLLTSSDTSIFTKHINTYDEKLYKIDTFYVYPKAIPSEPFYLGINIYGKEAEKLTSIPFQRMDNFPFRDFKLKQFLLANENAITEDLNIFSSKKASIKKDDFWHYLTILPYSINIYSGNLKPQSKVANFIILFHWLLGSIVLLALITSIIYESINVYKTKKQINSKQT